MLIDWGGEMLILGRCLFWGGEMLIDYAIYFCSREEMPRISLALVCVCMYMLI